MTRYHIKLLLTMNDGSDQIRTFAIDAWNADEAIEQAKGLAWQYEEVVEVECQGVS